MIYFMFYCNRLNDRPATNASQAHAYTLGAYISAKITIKNDFRATLGNICSDTALLFNAPNCFKQIFHKFAVAPRTLSTGAAFN